jgi:chromate reductase
MLTLLGIPGALRAASTNRLLLAEARRAFGEARQTEADLRLPLYDGDLEDREGIPPAVQTLADQIAAADAVVIATPEYNKAPPGSSRTRSTGSAAPGARPSATSPWPSSRPPTGAAGATARSSRSA